MERTKKHSDAFSHAKELGELIGFCVFDGWHYTGTYEELDKIGCVNIIDPSGHEDGEGDEIRRNIHRYGHA